MIILGIETSCDETALSILKAEGEIDSLDFDVLGNTILSQVKLHEKYGGVLPFLAKREHAKNLIPLLKKTLKEANLYMEEKTKIPSDIIEKTSKILEREPDLFPQFIEFIKQTKKPDINTVGVTFGPGLEPALWVGINFAKALGLAWNMPVVPINHMEGHIVSVLTETMVKNRKSKVHKVEFPAIALLISGGHTELVLIKNWGNYEVIGKTRDDAVGEAFDKVARMLSLPYPGGKEISKLAGVERTSGDNSTPYILPRPMLHSPDLDFSFSGLKTAVLYTLKEIPEVTETIKQKIAKEFEDAVIDVIVAKTKKAMFQHETKTLIMGGGVSANKTIQKALKELVKEFKETKLLIPEQELSTDNALMIAIATYIKVTKDKTLLEVSDRKIVAEGNVKL
ncbi:MAG: tRNA (adenosine(37)-N6)-threonylcarbamoyltransferase complex transferase subunit TsaD [Parcubacteria group bacterium]|nr:tRNA (adenosine(37)-N6)-threonylcarbamoyltransferase complex transferase subunit TsaD [Parcubacteria group bacterium]